jgi:hypothetical protein
MNKEDKSMDKEEILREALLDHYKSKQPRPFIQYDAFAPDELYSVFTFELMRTLGVRVLIARDIEKEQAVKILNRIIGWIERDGFLWSEGAEDGERVRLISNVERAKKISSMKQALHDAGYSEGDLKLLAEPDGLKHGLEPF